MGSLLYLLLLLLHRMRGNYCPSSVVLYHFMLSVVSNRRLIFLKQSREGMGGELTDYQLSGLCGDNKSRESERRLFVTYPPPLL